MSFFRDSSQYLARFENGTQASGDDYPCTVVQLTEDRQRSCCYTIEEAGDIHAIQDAPLTILIAPLDEAEEESLAGFRALVSRFKIPGTFIEERSQNILNSFGYKEESKSASCESKLPQLLDFTRTWLHFLLKEVEHDEEPILDIHQDRSPLFRSFGQFLNKYSATKPKMQNHESEKPRRYIPFRQPKDDQEPYSPAWSKCAFFLRAEKVSQPSKLQRPACASPPLDPGPESSDGPRRSLSDSNLHPGQDGCRGQTAAPTFQNAASEVSDQPPRYNVTLVCFDAPAPLKDELEALSNTLNVEDVLQHPYILWEVILYHLSMFLDVEMWDLVKVFSTEQRDLGYLTGRPSKSLGDLDFSRLHLLADHIILIIEGARGLQASIDGLIDHHEAELAGEPSFLARKTHHAIKYRQRFVQSTTERGITFEKRINNMISLFFNHVSLQDSGLMMRDSSSLRSIALITLFFLPITTVSTICGSEFIYTLEGPDGSTSVRMDPAVWKMFLISGIATLVLVGAWIWQLNRLERQFSRGLAGTPRTVGNLPLAV